MRLSAAERCAIESASREKTLRDTTERPETVTIGTNELIGTDPAALKPARDKLFDGRWKKGAVPEKWDGRTGERIAEVLERLLGR
jgi:UDP-N-acetylglucosamine 2-epimerase (non-hydrolysing)